MKIKLNKREMEFTYDALQNLLYELEECYAWANDYPREQLEEEIKVVKGILKKLARFFEKKFEKSLAETKWEEKFVDKVEELSMEG